MPSRQERRKAKRDAAKRAPGQGAGGAAAAGANVITNRIGDWTTQAEHPWALFQALGAETLRQRAAAGDREAQWSQGYKLVMEADGGAGQQIWARPADRRRRM
jgi:hypothetical protein